MRWGIERGRRATPDSSPSAGLHPAVCPRVPPPPDRCANHYETITNRAARAGSDGHCGRTEEPRAGDQQQNVARPARLGAVVVVAVSPVAASATGRGDPRREREQVRERQAEVAAEVDVLRGEQADVEAALDAIEANVAGQRASVEDARRASDAAVAAAAQALSELGAAEQALV